MAGELGHKALAEAHDLCVGFALRVEVGAALAAAHRQRGQAVLKALLEAEELDDGQVDGGVEAHAALIGAQGAVVLHAVAAVDLHMACVVNPGNAEHHDALGLHHALEKPCFFVFGMSCQSGFDRGQNLGDGLDEFRFIGVFRLHLFDDACCVRHAASCDIEGIEAL